MGWSTGVSMKSYHLLNHSIWSTYLSSTVLELYWNLSSLHIASWIPNFILVILTWLHLTWFPKEFLDSTRHLAWNAEKTPEGQQHCLLLSSFALLIFHYVLSPTKKRLISLSPLCVFFVLLKEGNIVSYNLPAFSLLPTSQIGSYFLPY